MTNVSARTALAYQLLATIALVSAIAAAAGTLTVHLFWPCVGVTALTSWYAAVEHRRWYTMAACAGHTLALCYVAIGSGATRYI